MSAIDNPAIPGLTSRFSQGTTYVNSLVNYAITTLIVVGGVYFMVQLMLGGLDWIRAGSDKATLESARSKITSALIGITILFSVWAVIDLLEVIFGIDITTFDIPLIAVG